MKILLSSILVGVFFFGLKSFASGNGYDIESQGSLVKTLTFLYQVSHLFSWLWIILGNLAGKLMTNDLIFGGFINLDTYLWKTWQIVRTFSNFAIGFLFVYYIFEHLVKSYSNKSDNNIKKNVINLLIASVFVQMSWFLVMAIVDISTILIATVSSFPAQVVSQDLSIQNELMGVLKDKPVWAEALVGNVVVIDVGELEQNKSMFKTIPANEGEALNLDQLIDNILPAPNSLSGPLMFLGFSVFKVNKFNILELSKKSINTREDFFKELMIVIVDAGMIFLYSLSLVILVVVNIFRILMIWLFAVASPVVVLVKVLGKGKSKNGELFELLELGTLLKMIFKPVLFALFISLSFIVVLLFSRLFEKHKLNISEVYFTHTPEISEDGTPTRYLSEMKIEKMFKMTIYQGGKTIGEILVAFIAVFLMWFLVKLAIKSKTGIKRLDTFTQGTTELVEKAIGAVGIIPTPEGAIGFGSVSKVMDKYKTSGPLATMLNKRAQQDEDRMMQMLGLKKNIKQVRGPEVKNMITDITSADKERKADQFGGLTSLLKNNYNGYTFASIEQPLMDWIKSDAWGANDLNAMGIQQQTLYGLKKAKDGKEFFGKILGLESADKKKFFEGVLGVSDSSEVPNNYEDLKKMEVKKDGKAITRN